MASRGVPINEQHVMHHLVAKIRREDLPELGLLDDKTDRMREMVGPPVQLHAQLLKAGGDNAGAVFPSRIRLVCCCTQYSACILCRHHDSDSL